MGLEFDKKNSPPEMILEKIKKSKRIAMTLHIMPDGDSIAVCTAMKYFLKRDFGIESDIYNSDTVTEELGELSFCKEVLFGKDLTEADLKKYDLVLCLDSAREYMLSAKHPDFEFPENVFVINIDHHNTNPYYGNLNYVDIGSPSTCSVVLGLMKKWGVKFDSELSTRLLLGICTDTKFFQVGERVDEALKDTVFLIEKGAEYFERVVKPVLYNIPLKRKKFEKILLNNMRYDEELKVGWSCVSYDEWKKIGMNEAEIRTGIQNLEGVKDFDFVFVLIQMEDGRIKGSFRGNKGVNVVRYAEGLGGGGHKYAAAFMLDEMTIKEAEARVLGVIEELGVKRE